MSLKDQTCEICGESTRFNPCPRCHAEQFCPDDDHCNACGDHPRAEVSRPSVAKPRETNYVVIVRSIGQHFAELYETQPQAVSRLNETTEGYGPYELPCPAEDCEWCDIVGDVVCDVLAGARYSPDAEAGEHDQEDEENEESD